jgi:hypothetical protein
MPVAPAGRPDWLVEPTVDADSAHGASHRADHTSLPVLPGRSSADVDAGDVPAGRSAQSVSALRRFAGVDLDNPITLFKSFDRRSAGNGGREDGVGMGTKVDGFMPQLNSGRRRPAERLASAMIFAAFVAVAALVGVICVTSLNAAFQDEKNTENLLHDARAFVPAQPGGTLPIDSFEGLQKPNMGHELSPHDNWAGHNFDVAFVTGDGGNSQEAKSSLGRMQQLTGVSRAAPAITAHVHGTRMSGLLHQKKSEGKETSADIQESLDKQADYIIGYPDLSDHSKGRTQDLVQRSHGNRIGMPALPALHPLRIQQEHHALRIGVYPVCVCACACACVCCVVCEAQKVHAHRSRNSKGNRETILDTSVSLGSMNFLFTQKGEQLVDTSVSLGNINFLFTQKDGHELATCSTFFGGGHLVV